MQGGWTEVKECRRSCLDKHVGSVEGEVELVKEDKNRVRGVKPQLST